VIEPSIIRKLEAVFSDTIKEAKRQGIEADILSGWHTGEEICARWKIGWSTLTAAKKRLAAKAKGTK